MPCKAYIAQKAVEYALSKIGFPFDNDFDLADTTKFLVVPNWYGELIFSVGIASYLKGKRHNIKIVLGFP